MVELSKLFLNRPDVAVKTYIVVPADSADRVLDELVKKSLLEPLPAGEARREAEKLAERLELASKTAKLVQELSNRLAAPVEVEVKDLPWDLDQGLAKLYNELLDTLRLVRGLERELAELEQRAERLAALKKVVDAVEGRGAEGLVLEYDGDIVVVRTVYGSREEVAKLEEASLKTLTRLEAQPGKDVAVLVFERKSYEGVREDVERLRVEVAGLPLGDLGQLKRAIEQRLNEARARVGDLRRKVGEVVWGKVYEIALAKVLAETVESKIGVLRDALESRYLTLIAGWTLKSRAKEVEGVARENRGVALFEEAPDPPVEFNNLKPFKPFELFTEIMGYPSPTEWDPTPLLTYLYLVFFSLMFPDVGYGIGLIIGARLVLPYFVENKDTLRRLIKIATYAGVTGIVTGLLSGSFFGSLLGQYITMVIPSVIPSLPPKLGALEDIGPVIIRYLGLALGVGYFMVLMSHGIGLYKNLVNKNRVGAVSEMLLISLMLIAPPAIKVMFRFNVDVLGLLRIIPGDMVSNLAVGVLVAYAVFKSVVDRPFGVMLWIFDVLGVMADVLSFVRIAGIALGGAIMAELINSLVFNVAGAAGSIYPVIGFFVGLVAALSLHVVNLGLSSISPFVHSLRLIMYEVSSKFYEGGGRRIAPSGVGNLVVRVGGGLK
ncbi:hypothetical protein WLZ34_06325 [Thermogladius sp. KZ2Tp1]|uniref:V-type ATP synthase subunit I n=1 Tax=Thermogladius sp. KZ2Tp1 TaxID=3136289 RepID=UPI003DA88AB3